MAVAYIGARDVMRAGITTAALCRFTGHLSAPAASDTTLLNLGASPLVVPSDLVVGDPITLLDGTFSEVVYATSAINPSGYTVSCTPLQSSHALGIEYALDGAGGSLGDVLLRAGASLENYTRQSLLLQSYTDSLRLRISQRAIRHDGGLVLYPSYYPVASMTSLAMQYDGFTDQFTLDPTQFIIDHIRERFFLPYLQLLQAAILYADDLSEGSGLATFGNGRGFLATLVYQSGYPFGALPGDLAQAALLYVRAELAKNGNPDGVQQIKMGNRSVTYRGSSDTKGVSEYEREAQNILDNSYVKSGHRRT
jgi:hypothetical protein